MPIPGALWLGLRHDGAEVDYIAGTVRPFCALLGRLTRSGAPIEPLQTKDDAGRHLKN